MACVTVLLVLPQHARAQESRGAVLLQPESDMDRELADDLTEVLISAVIDKSDRSLKIEGKESFKRVLTEKKASDGNVCLSSMECVRIAGKEMGLNLLVLGKVGKSATGFRLEVWRLSMDAKADRKPYRKAVTGDVARLIEEMDSAADWVLSEPESSLTISVEPAGASLLLDGSPAKADAGPIKVAPGKHKVRGSSTGFEDSEVEVDCPPDGECSAKLVLAKKAVVPDKIPDKPKDDKKKPVQPGLSTGTVVASSVLGGIAVLAGGGSLFFFIKKTQAENDIADFTALQCPDGKCKISEKQYEDSIAPTKADGERNAEWATIMGIGAGVAAVAGATEVLVDLISQPGSTPKSAFVPAVRPGMSSLSLEWVF